MLVITRGYSIQYSHAKDAYDHLPKLGCPNSPAADPAFLSRWPPHVKKKQKSSGHGYSQYVSIEDFFKRAYILYIYIYIICNYIYIHII